MKAYYVETADLRKNMDTLVRRAGDSPLWAVLKGDGYGLGLEKMAELCRQSGIARFAVTEVSDVARLREAGFQDEQILMLRPTADSDEIRALLEHNAILTVSAQDNATVLNGIAAQLGIVAEAHVKIDTGMGRYGFLPSEMDKLLSVYAYMDGIAVSGIYTHLHSAFCNKKQTYAQVAQFEQVLDAIREAGYETGEAHLCNSSAFLRYGELAERYGVRVGSALLGRLSIKGSYNLKRIGVCEAAINEVRWLPKGHTCGYGAAWTARRPTRIAVIPVGWYHGFGCEKGRDIFRLRDQLRQIFSALKGIILRPSCTVWIGGKCCRVLGHIGMLHTVCDVTDVECRPGDKATLEINPLLCKGMDVIYR